MFVFNLLLIFLIIPTLLVVGAHLLPLVARFWFIFIFFPVVLILFTLWSHFRKIVRTDSHQGGGA